MSLNLETNIEIQASPEEIWKVLTDFQHFPSWNPFITEINGKASRDEILSIQIHPPGGKPMRFQPKLVAVIPNREMRWKGKLLINGLFDGEHYFLIEPIDTKRSLFIHGERFKGLLVPLLKSTLAKTKEGFIHMNQALKKRCES